MQLKETNEKKFHQSHLVDVQSYYCLLLKIQTPQVVLLGPVLKFIMRKKKEMEEQFYSLLGDKKFWRENVGCINYKTSTGIPRFSRLMWGVKTLRKSKTGTFPKICKQS